MSNSSASRRVFLKVLGAGGAAIGATAMVGCGDDGTGSDPATGDIAAGNISALPENTLRAVSGQPVAIGRDAGGVYAMTTICPHEQCDMTVDGSISITGVTCSCHNSTFTANGDVTQGPATSNLEHYEVVIDAGGEITIHAGKVVDASTRAAVPA